MRQKQILSVNIVDIGFESCPYLLLIRTYESSLTYSLILLSLLLNLVQMRSQQLTLSAYAKIDISLFINDDLILIMSKIFEEERRVSRNIYGDYLRFGRVLRTQPPSKLSLSPVISKIYQVISLLAYSLRATKIVSWRYSFSFGLPIVIAALFLIASNPQFWTQLLQAFCISQYYYIKLGGNLLQLNLINSASKMGAHCCSSQEEPEIIKPGRKPHINDHMAANTEEQEQHTKNAATHETVVQPPKEDFLVKDEPDKETPAAEKAPTTKEAIIIEEANVMIKAVVEEAPDDPGVEPDCLEALKEPITQETDSREFDLENESSSKHLIEFISPISKGGFQTAIPVQCVEDERIEDIQETIRDLKKQKDRGGNEEEIKLQHDSYVDDLAQDEENPYYKEYYLRLYCEVFKVTIRLRDLTPEEKLKEAYQLIDEVIEQGEQSQVSSLQDSSQFKLITQFSSEFDESGEKIDDDSNHLHLDNQTQKIKEGKFDEMIRDLVYMVLKYRGSLHNMLKSPYFINKEQKNEFFYKCSAKVPFYFIHQCSPQLQNELMMKYLENPFNPMMLVTYNQRIEGLKNLAPSDTRVERTIHMNIAYNKFRDKAPTLICIGNPSSKKSTFINDVFGAQFEVMSEGVSGLFHDSIDALFTSKDMPIDFNILDFQGTVANRDYMVIESLLSHIPMSYLLVQVSDDKYLPEVLMKVSADLLAKLKNRTIIVIKNMKGKDKELLTTVKKQIGQYLPDLNQALQVKRLDEDYGPVYDKLCQYVLEFYQKTIKQQNVENEDQLSQLEADLKAQHRANGLIQTEHEYKHIYGFYWLLTDSLMRLKGQFQIKTLRDEFRKEHMEVKQFLFSQTDMSELSRKKIFPFYAKELALKKINDDLIKRTSKTSQDDLRKEKQRLKKWKPAPSSLFQSYVNALMSGRQGRVKSVLELVEAHYQPRITDDQKLIRQEKAGLEKLKDKMMKMEDQYGRLIQPATQQQKNEYDRLKTQWNEIEKRINKIRDEVEDKVLDSELFLREAKQYFLKQDYGSKNKLHEFNKILLHEFNKILGEDFENGQPIEVIDGDIDQIEESSLAAILEWVQNKLRHNKKLLVVTIFGPQSSGKSTLLNYLVGAKFHVSAGRCTKGLNAMLFRTDFEETKEILILDSEGIFSIERNDPMYDRRLAIFCMAVSNILLINIKGELSSEIQKVLQVAIYALKKIAQVQASLHRTKIHFILRDQIDTSTAQMETAFSVLKNNLRQAAQAAGASLEELIQIPRHAEDIISMFSSALSQVRIHENDTYMQTRSSEQFRKQCAQLRTAILKIAVNMPQESRILNLQKWGQDATVVLTAVMENDDLVAITDLAAINNSRLTVMAVEEFRQIMSQSAPAPDSAMATEWIRNPLLPGNVPEQFKNDQMIAADQTIFAELSRKIDEAILQREMLSQNKMLRNSAHHNNLVDTQKEEFLSAKKFYEEKYCDQATFFTQKFTADIQNTAKETVRNIISQIFRKAVAKWENSMSSATIDSSLATMMTKCKQVVFDQQVKSVKITFEEFKTAIEKIADVTRKDIRSKFFKTAEDVKDEAKAEFQKTEQRMNMAEEIKEDEHPANDEESEQSFEERSESFHSSQKVEPSTPVGKHRILQQRFGSFFGSRESIETINDLIQLTDLEMSEFQVDATNATSLKYAEPNLVTQHAALEDYIENSSYTYKKQKREFESKQLERKKQRSLPNLRIRPTSLMLKESPNDRMERLEREELKNLKETLMEQFKPEIAKTSQNRIYYHWQNLRQKIQEVKDEIEQINNEQKVVQSIPGAVVDKLFTIFENEMQRQNSQRSINHSAGTQNQIADLINYKQTEYVKNFNQIYLNLLIKQIQRNDNLNFETIEEKIQLNMKKQLNYFQQINQDVEGDQDAAKQFTKSIAEQLIDVLSKELLAQFDQKTESMDSCFKKDDILKAAIKAFQEAEDTETIVQHMHQPIDLERRVIKKQYKILQHSYEQEAIAQFDTIMLQGMKRCQEFMNSVISAIRDKGNQNSSITNQHKEDYLEYLLGSLMQGLVAQNLVDPFKSKKTDVEMHLIFSREYTLPDSSQGLLDIGPISKPYSKPEFNFSNKVTIKQIAPKIQMINFFTQMCKFESDNDDCAIKDIISTAKAKFVRLVRQKVKNMQNLEYSEQVALGCMAKCHFCGARCTNTVNCKTAGIKHKTNFHRPMAFAGTSNYVGDKKKLVQGYCTSDQILNKSRWPKPDDQLTPSQMLLRTLKKNPDCTTTSGFNLILKWESGSDLDIQVQCGCEIWHGFCTQGGSEGQYQCEECEMFQLRNDEVADEYRRQAFAHVIFANPRKLIGKTIGMACVTSTHNTQMPQNWFLLTVINEHGKQLFPESGLLEQEPWMVCGNENGETSEKKFYTFKSGDASLGQNQDTIGFEEYSNLKAQEQQDQQWEFNRNAAKHFNFDADFVEYRESWIDKWQIVKDIICGSDFYECEEVDQVLSFSLGPS